jgi:lipid A 3-O-deacylase
LRFRLTIVSLLTLCAATILALAPARAADDDPDFLELQLGTFDIRHAHTFAADLEYRSGYKILGYVKPMVGMMTTSRGAFYGYGGFAMDIYFGRRIVITPSLAVGAYNQNNDVHLGAWFPEFRSSFEIAYRFDDRSRLGVMFHHISNAGTTKSNPGAETAMLTYAYPLSKLREQLFGK